MANDKYKPTPQSAEDRRALQPETHLSSVPPSHTDYSKREYQTDKKGSPKPPHIGLQDIDESIMYYFSEVISPTVIQNNKKIRVPIMYGSPERWANIQEDGALRDKNGKFMAPLIMFKRSSLSKDRSLTNKVDANHPSNFAVVKNTYTRQNVYDNFSALTNRRPKEEYYATIVPEFVTITYSCVAFTDYVEQMNKIIEAANYAEDSYWGDPAKFMFRARIDTFGTTVEAGTGTDRVVTTNFDITLKGYVIPEVSQADMQNFRKFFSKSQLTFNLEVAGTLEQLVARADSAPKQLGLRFFDDPAKTVQVTNTTIISGSGLTDEGKAFLTAAKIIDSTNTTVVVDSNNSTVTFLSTSIMDAPLGFTAPSKDEFQVFINGQLAEPSAIDSIVESGSSVVVTFNNNLNYAIEVTDEFAIVGKFD